MPIQLRPIDLTNWQQCLKLSPRADQAGFVAPNVYSLAEAGVDPSCAPLGLYAGDTLVGFAMVAVPAAPQRPGYAPRIARFMIDEKFQGQGFGRAGMQAVIGKLRSETACRSIYLSYAPTNHAAAALYASLGFRSLGPTSWGEIAALLDSAAAPIAPA